MDVQTRTRHAPGASLASDKPREVLQGSERKQQLLSPRGLFSPEGTGRASVPGCTEINPSPVGVGGGAVCAGTLQMKILCSVWAPGWERAGGKR